MSRLNNNKRDNIWWNIGTMVIVFALYTILYTYSDVVQDAGMAAIILMWIPAGIGLFTLVVYLVSKMFFKKNNWIISLIGILIGLIVTIAAYL